jgi:hypothetical protein
VFEQWLYLKLRDKMAKSGRACRKPGLLRAGNYVPLDSAILPAKSDSRHCALASARTIRGEFENLPPIVAANSARVANGGQA